MIDIMNKLYRAWLVIKWYLNSLSTSQGDWYNKDAISDAEYDILVDISNNGL